MRKVTIAIALALATLTSQVQKANAQPPSGMMLGIYAFNTWRGLYVVNTIPGFSAEGRLFRGDVLQRVTADGFHVYSARSLSALEFAKDQIGPNRMASLEVFRPGVGLVYFWVEFVPIGIAARAMTTDGSAPQKAPVKARMLTERERPGARQLFQRSGTNNNGNAGSGAGRPNQGNRPILRPPVVTIPPVQQGDRQTSDAASLFRRR